MPEANQVTHQALTHAERERFVRDGFVRIDQAFIHPQGEPFALPDHQPEFLLRGLTFLLDPRVRLQLRQPLPCPDQRRPA